jgi:predicted ATP-grasp superfamily ATP-dependent carboligase
LPLATEILMLGALRKRRPPRDPLAYVLGDMDLVRPLGLAGIRCAVVASENCGLAHSRYTERLLPLKMEDGSEEEWVEALVTAGLREAQPPVLFFQEDTHLLMVSRHRRRLAQAFRFALPEADFIEQLVDKARFQRLSEERALPVPRTRVLHPTPDSQPPALDLRYPLIVKPLTRLESWATIERGGKALALGGVADLAALWPRLTAAGIDLLAQELIPGPESAMESYHVYVDAQGEVAGEFTGRKIRTLPATYGHSTALTLTDIRTQGADVAALGRDVAARIGLRGVAKFDFKRAPDGGLHLLEINPRFNLWHHLGAVAGVNLPALVYADLTGRRRPRAAIARAGACWCRLKTDRLAVREAGGSTLSWLLWAVRCEASSIQWDDPLPFLQPKLQRLMHLWPKMRSAPPSPVKT